MENKRITAECTLDQYRTEYASKALYKELNACLKYVIIATVLMIPTMLLQFRRAVFFVAPMLCFAVAAVMRRNKICAFLSATAGVLLMVYILWIVPHYNYGVPGILLLLLSIPSGILSVVCCAKILQALKKIDTEYRDLMANLRG